VFSRTAEETTVTDTTAAVAGAPEAISDETAATETRSPSSRSRARSTSSTASPLAARRRIRSCWTDWRPTSPPSSTRLA